MNIQIKPFYYNKTKSEDGITHKVILDKQELAYNVTISKTYWNGVDDENIRSEIIKDLILLKRELINESYKRKGLGNDKQLKSIDKG